MHWAMVLEVEAEAMKSFVYFSLVADGSSVVQFYGLFQHCQFLVQ
jgi:hypothetical protein